MANACNYLRLLAYQLPQNTFNYFIFAVFDFNGESDTKDTVNGTKMSKSVRLDFTETGSMIVVLFNGLQERRLIGVASSLSSSY